MQRTISGKFPLADTQKWTAMIIRVFAFSVYTLVTLWYVEIPYFDLFGLTWDVVVLVSFFYQATLRRGRIWCKQPVSLVRI